MADWRDCLRAYSISQEASPRSIFIAEMVNYTIRLIAGYGANLDRDAAAAAVECVLRVGGGIDDVEALLRTMCD